MNHGELRHGGRLIFTGAEPAWRSLVQLLKKAEKKPHFL
jgi:hypothetical protein